MGVNDTKGNQKTDTKKDILEKKIRAAKKLDDARMRLLFKFPFYGHLLLHLKFSLANCGTAATDMRRIIFDPEFVVRLSEQELDFLLKHEIMHCVLQHCIRGKGKNQYVFNIACDIVVNSNIMQTMGVSSFSVDGKNAMHLTPNHKEGYLYSAEDVYQMLLEKYDVNKREVDEVLRQLQNDYGNDGIDDHAIWSIVPQDNSLSDEWKKNLKDTVSTVGSNGECPPGARKLLEDYIHESKLNWRAILHEFIKEINDRYDFSFCPPDRRFAGCDFILPSFTENLGEQVDNLWFVVDSSGSISMKKLTMALEEIKAAIEQFHYLSGKLSFFDTSVTEPAEFDSVEQLKEITPVGGGGTSFYSIFKAMKEYFGDELPTAVIVLTDGYAVYPDEEVALGIPVLWIIAGDNKEDAKWGVTIHI